MSAMAGNDEPFNEALHEEAIESWDQIISEEVVYALQPVNPNLKVSNGIRHFDWVAKYYTGAFDIHLKFGLLGQRNVYFKSILSVAPPSVRDAGSNIHAVVEGGNGHLCFAKTLSAPEIARFASTTA